MDLSTYSRYNKFMIEAVMGMLGIMETEDYFLEREKQLQILLCIFGGIGAAATSAKARGIGGNDSPETMKKEREGLLLCVDLRER